MVNPMRVTTVAGGVKSGNRLPVHQGCGCSDPYYYPPCTENKKGGVLRMETASGPVDIDGFPLTVSGFQPFGELLGNSNLAELT